MGYNILSGTTSVVNVTTSGSFMGDGSQLEGVKQFEIPNAGDTRVPFYKLVNGEYQLDANGGFIFNNNAVTLPSLSASIGIRLSSPISGVLAGNGSFLGLNSSGDLVVTQSAAGTGPTNSLQFHAGGGAITGSPDITFSQNILTANCGLIFKRQQVTSTVTMSATDYFIGVSASSPIIIQMPGAETLSSGQLFVIKDEAGNAETHNITIKASSSQTIDGESSIILESPFASVNLYTNGSNKFFIY